MFPGNSWSSRRHFRRILPVRSGFLRNESATCQNNSFRFENIPWTLGDFRNGIGMPDFCGFIVGDGQNAAFRHIRAADARAHAIRHGPVKPTLHVPHPRYALRFQPTSDRTGIPLPSSVTAIAPNFRFGISCLSSFPRCSRAFFHIGKGFRPLPDDFCSSPRTPR